MADAPKRAVRPAIVLSTSLSGLLRAGDEVTIAGRVRGAAAGTRVTLQTSRSKAWTVVVGAPLRAGGRFRLRWLIGGQDTGLISIRVAALQGGRVVAATKPQQQTIGQASVPCSPPAPPTDVPSGDGWVVGGLYIEGGAYPGIDQCFSGAYSATATSTASAAATTVGVAGGHSYTIVLPAGGYALKAGCSVPAQATVVAGRQTVADTRCLVP